MSITLSYVLAPDVPVGAVLGERIVFAVHRDDVYGTITLELTGRGKWPELKPTEKVIVIEGEYFRPKLLRGWPTDPDILTERDYDLRELRHDKGYSHRSAKRDKWDMSDAEILAYKQKGMDRMKNRAGGE